MIGKRLAIVSTHPIQYHGAWFRRLASESGLSIEVLYCHNATATEQANAGFGVEFDWDVSLLDGYPHRFLKNVARQPGIAGFSGLDTPEISDILAREHFDAVMINGWHYKSAWQTMRGCWKTQTPVMVRSDSHLHTERSGLKRAGKWPFYRWFVSKLDACLPVGTWSSDYFFHYGATEDRVFIVPHVIDTDYFQSESKRLESGRSVLRAKWGLSDAAVVLLFAGKFIEKKRPLDFVNAIGQAKSLGAEVEGLMVGDGPLRAACEQLAREENLPIKFAGFLNQSKITAAYVAADALVLPSDGGETWGLVVNEAMACGVPCFVSDRVGCGPDMIRTGETGATFPLGDSKALGQMLAELAANKERVSWMSERAREKAQQYTLDVAVDRTIQALEAVSG
jgi:glycosyltransferase involved in cell wall biosynthesis